jgi:probable phosphoglycerate mutase
VERLEDDEMYLARHGETEWNRDGRMQGRLGGPLTDKGRAQAQALAAAAHSLGIKHLVCSPLARARETAGIVAAALGVQARVVEALVETDFGTCSGLTEAQIAKRYPELRAERERDKWHHRWPDGESYADLVERVRPVVAEWADGSMIVAHQSLNRVLAHLLAPAAVADVLAMAQPSDVLLRFGDGAPAHARLVAGLGGAKLEWLPGLYGSAAPRLN